MALAIAVEHIVNRSATKPKFRMIDVSEPKFALMFGDC